MNDGLHPLYAVDAPHRLRCILEQRQPGDVVSVVPADRGANDVQGTLVREEIFRAAGSTTGTEQTLEQLVRAVRTAGRIPVQRDTLYNELQRWDA